MIRIEGVTKRFGRSYAVRDASLAIGAGESVALWGANGAGKTTLIRCVLGLLRCRGRVSVGGEDVRRRGKRARSRIGYVPQEIGFYDDLRVGEALVFFSRLKGLSSPDAGESLGRVGLEGQGRKRIRELSGGMKQRLALAVALLGDPPVLILDEVTASLDACGRAEFVTLLSRLAGTGRTLLFASHRVEEITALAGRVVGLEKGRIAWDVSTQGFVDLLGTSSTLHLTLRTEARQPAMSVLRERGFSPRLNGHGILVPVPRDQKAAPFRVLAEASIAIEDFELLAGAAGEGDGKKEDRP